MMGWDERYQQILKEVFQLYIRKRGDYEHDDNHSSSLRRVKNIGINQIIGIIVRLIDKFNLIEKQLQDGKYDFHDETFRETLLDICSYSILAVLFIDEKESSDLSSTVINVK